MQRIITSRKKVSVKKDQGWYSESEMKTDLKWPASLGSHKTHGWDTQMLTLVWYLQHYSTLLPRTRITAAKTYCGDSTRAETHVRTQSLGAQEPIVRFQQITPGNCNFLELATDHHICYWQMQMHANKLYLYRYARPQEEHVSKTNCMNLGMNPKSRVTNYILSFLWH